MTDEYVYRSGIPTLRSSKHRVRAPKQKIPQPKNTSKTLKETLLPPSIRIKECFKYDALKYDLKGSIISLLSNLDPKMIGIWSPPMNDQALPNTTMDEVPVNMGTSSSDYDSSRLENLRIPPISLTRKVNKGNVEEVQQYLSDAVHTSEEFLATFDQFVTEVILPLLKQRLIDKGVLPLHQKVTFYYQRPPTLRLQPGPARAMVNTHRDSEYGHQGGELNFFVPLTDRHLTGVDLYCESDADLGDYSPLGVDMGYFASFHGSSCRHFVNRNDSVYTRASLDFRVGISPFYDDSWMMVGTCNDHLRRKMEL